MSIDNLAKSDQPLVIEDNYHPALEMDLYLINEFYANNKLISTYRDYKNGNYYNLYQDIKNTNWNSLFKSDCIDEKVNILTQCIIKSINNNIPLKNVKQSKFPKWFSPLTITAINNKNKFRKLFKKTDNINHRTKFLQYRTQAKQLIKRDKSVDCPYE